MIDNSEENLRKLKKKSTKSKKKPKTKKEKPKKIKGEEEEEEIPTAIYLDMLSRVRYVRSHYREEVGRRRYGGTLHHELKRNFSLKYQNRHDNFS